MKYSLDLNLLLYSVDEESPFHKRAKEFLQSILQSEDLCILSWETVYGFLRIGTHPGIFRNALPAADALQNMIALVNHPQVRMASANKDSWEVFQNLSQQMLIKGNLAPDALLASILEANGVRKLYTRDSDYRKFPYLKPVDPL